MADEKTAEKAKYYKWLDLSDEERALSNMPLTQDAYSKATGTSRQTLIKWRGKRGSGGANGDFDIREAFRKDYKMLWELFTKEAKEGKINATLFKTFAQLADELVEKREDTLKVEFTANDRIRVAAELCDSLISEYRDTGNCPVCGFSKALHVPSLLVDRREQQPEDTVATVALSS